MGSIVHGGMVYTERCTEGGCKRGGAVNVGGVNVREDVNGLRGGVSERV